MFILSLFYQEIYHVIEKCPYYRNYPKYHVQTTHKTNVSHNDCNDYNLGDKEMHGEST